MSEIILWSLLAFFGAFGLVEFIRFVYTDWCSSDENFHVVIRADKANENLEAVIRNTLIATNSHSVIVLTNNTDGDEGYILEKLQKKFLYIDIMGTEEYIDFLKK